jgi:hypothetical protein
MEVLIQGNLANVETASHDIFVRAPADHFAYTTVNLF